MSALYLDPEAVAARRALAALGGPFAPLAASLAGDLGPALARPVWLPPEKARLTRAGGSCPRDGGRLAFDPFAPRAHRCPACGAVYDRDDDYAWWVMGYQLWLAERAVHAAALALVAPGAAADAFGVPAGAPTLGAFAARVLGAQADAYPAYPNADNVLGPTRPFFSTYLESLWLLHVCTALDLLCAAEPGRHDALAGRVRERVVAPSRALVAGFPEGTSNRQVWHAAARLAASLTLGDAPGARDAVHGPHGVADLLATALLGDGSWFEGENYHQFAHRGFWYALRLAERAGIEVAPALVGRFRAGYVVPWRVALPDETLPARRDAQYAVSLRQWRWAEWCELGLTDGAPDALGASLARLYAPADPPLPHRTGRRRATGESERNEPASALSRADLGWKSLLFARAEPLAAGPGEAPRSELLAEQGYAVLRRGAGRGYAALDYGGGGGGHGHPDRLNVILQDGRERWLDDPGTGTYVERALHWYRSTLAHAAPLVDGRSQPRGRGMLLGFDPGPDRPSGGDEFALAAATAVLGDVLAARALVACDTYVLDLFTWRAAAPRVVDLPFGVDGEPLGERAFWTPCDPGGAGGLEDGFDFVHDASGFTMGDRPVRLALFPHLRPGFAAAQARDAHGENGPPGDGAALWLAAPGATLWRARAPGPPGAGERRFHAVRMRGSAGAVAAVWDLRGRIAAVRTDADGRIHIEAVDGTTDRHEAPDTVRLERAHVAAASPPTAPRPAGVWAVERRNAGERVTAARRLGFSGPLVERAMRAAAARLKRDGVARARLRDRPALALPTAGAALAFTLGEHQYLRSEPSWFEAGAPTATVRVSAAGGALTVAVDVRLGRAPAFAGSGAANPLDNERADVNSDGLQLVVAPARAPDRAAAWLLVPEHPAPAVRVTPTAGGAPAGVPDAFAAAWHERPDGWQVTCRVPLAGIAGAGEALALDLAVNEKPPERERRRGQLLLSAADPTEPAPAFVYLRGDRLDASRALRLLLPRDAAAR